MARPSKSMDVLESEGRTHLTKQQKEARKNAEKAFATGEILKERPEVKENQVAHKEFKRVTKLLASVGKNDALFEGIINRYCMLQAECASFVEMREMFSRDLEQLRADETMDAETRYVMATKMQYNILNIDKQMQAKRKMSLDIEKECAMTISAAMRTVPKQPTTAANPLAEILGDDAYD